MKLIVIATAMALSLPASAVLAQNYPPPSLDQTPTQEQLDHLHDDLQHDREHQQIEDAHAREHASGFTSEAQHHKYHQQLEAIHGDVHDNLPGTEHAHDDGGYSSQPAYGAGQSYDRSNRGYGERPVERRTVVTRYVTRPVRHYRTHHHHTISYYR